MIMLIGSFGLWIGTPLLWLWVGSQIQGATQSLGTAFAAAFVGAVVTVVLLAWLLAKLSDVYRHNRHSRGRNDTGHVVLEAVLVVSAGLTVAAFLIWFFLLSGANPVPIGINI
jgi:heme/copper-type cytochrome/quinol oxidase subunit 2